jgi:predicted TPR repeat methyltransferase
VLLLGDVLRANAHLPAAIAEFQRALRLEPQSHIARLHLGEAWADAGEAERALEQYALLSVDVVPELRARVAEAKAMLSRMRSDPGYVRHLFDQFSTSYDERMRGQLAYRAPEILRELAALVMPDRNGLVALDLGCGTGLAGVAFAEIAPVIDGIDLSPAMIEVAKRRRIYRELVVGDIETALRENETRYDLIIAADTLVYLGELEPLFRTAAHGLNAGGFMLFTVESLEVGDFSLGPKRRWRHSESYLRRSAAAFKLEVAGLVSCTPRTEAGVSVAGLACALVRPR